MYGQVLFPHGTVVSGAQKLEGKCSFIGSEFYGICHKFKVAVGFRQGDVGRCAEIAFDDNVKFLKLISADVPNLARGDRGGFFNKVTGAVVGHPNAKQVVRIEDHPHFFVGGRDKVPGLGVLIVRGVFRDLADGAQHGAGGGGRRGQSHGKELQDEENGQQNSHFTTGTSLELGSALDVSQHK